VEWMTGVDASMLYVERPYAAANAGTLMYLDTSTMPGGYAFERFRDRHLAVTRKLEYARRRIVEVPFGLAHPAWAIDDDLDVDYHVGRIVLADGQGRAAARQILADELNKPLDRTKPLWRLFVVENVDVDLIAAIFVVNHVDFDGISGAALASFAFGPAEQIELAADASDVLSHCFQGTPSRGELLRWAAHRRLERWKGIPASLATVTRVVRRGRRTRRTVGIDRLSFFRDVPSVPWNHAYSERRVIGTFHTDLAALKGAAKRRSLTLHDHMLTALAGAFRDELLELGALPDIPCVVQCGVSLHDQDLRDGETANRWWGARVQLPTHLSDPVERSRAIEAQTTLKKARRSYGAVLWPILAEHLSANLVRFGLRLFELLHLAGRMQLNNGVFSTVPGPEEVLYFAGNEVVEMYAITSIYIGHGLMVVPFSYRGRMFFTIYADPASLPDVDRLGRRIEQHLALLDEDGSPAVVADAVGAGAR